MSVCLSVCRQNLPYLSNLQNHYATTTTTADFVFGSGLGGGALDKRTGQRRGRGARRSRHTGIADDRAAVRSTAGAASVAAALVAALAPPPRRFRRRRRRSASYTHRCRCRCCCCRPAAAVATAVLAAVIGVLSPSSPVPLPSLPPALPPPTCSATARSKLMACCARSSLCLPERNALPPAARSAVGSSTLCVFYFL